ncbi:hypothetical protein ACFT7S_11340 [Streptomyces sp. NPDC057136]|uniref:hypothetical protein n=1 Tax=Streptomyces sp. NPDC057136 TaxID=3346029 RepID=UPI0036305F01
MNIRAALTAVLMLAALAGCGSAGDATETNAKPSARSSPTATPTFDVHDCRALLDRDYDNDSLRDASGEPECAHLTHDEYLEVVKKTLTGRKDEILEDSAQHVVWDEAWEETDLERQQMVCERLLADGVEVVSQEMIDAAGDDFSGDEVEMSQYYLDEKC